MKWAHATFECSHCGAVFSSAQGLKAHALRHRGYLAEGARQAHAQPAVAFACSRCGAGFPSSDELRIHTVAHRDIVVEASPPHGGHQSRATPVTPVPPEHSEAKHPLAAPGSHPGDISRKAPELEPVGAGSRDVLHPRPLGAPRVARPARRARVMPRTVALVVAAAILVLLSGASALAWFSASTAGSARISTGTWGSYLNFNPGSSQAVHWSASGCARLTPVATLDDQGDLTLDFGDLTKPGGVWLDVFRVTSKANAPVQVTFVPNGAIAPLIGGVGFVFGGNGGSLDPEQTKSVFVRLCVTKHTMPGVYQGALLVSVIGGTERHSIPTTVRILGRKPRPSPSPSCSPTTSPSPSCSPTSTATPSCTPSPTPSATQPALFSSAAGLSTTLPQPGSTVPPVAVASVQADGSIALDFGQLPLDEAAIFTDVLRITGLTTRRATMTCALSSDTGAPGVQAGVWDAKRESFSRAQVLGGGKTVSIAVMFGPTSTATPGPQAMTLSITATLEDGRTQRTDYPLTFTWGMGSPSPAMSPSSSPTSTPSSPTPVSLSPSGLLPAGPRTTPTADRFGGATAWWSPMWALPILGALRPS